MPRTSSPAKDSDQAELVVITGVSGSGKGTVLKSLEDLGYYAVDNLPVGLIPKFAELVMQSPEIRRAALVIDVREGGGLGNLPAVLEHLRKQVPTTVLFLETDDATLIRRFSETRRPHPLGTGRSVSTSIRQERRMLEPIRALADVTIETTKFNVHELRDAIKQRFAGARQEAQIMVYVTSFGFRNGVPPDSDLLFDVRFLPNPNYIPEFKKLTGKHPKLAKYVRSFPQTREFLTKIGDLLVYLLPHYIREGKSYLTISFGCTGGQHRSVMIASDIARRLSKAGYQVKETHRDVPKRISARS